VSRIQFTVLIDVEDETVAESHIIATLSDFIDNDLGDRTDAGLVRILKSKWSMA